MAENKVWVIKVSSYISFGKEVLSKYVSPDD